MSSSDSYGENPSSLTCRPMIVDRECPIIRYPNICIDRIAIEPLEFRASSSGWLGSLPQELKQDVLMNLDLSTLGSLRLTNFEFLSLVNSIPAYQRVREHASTALRALHETDTMKYHSLNQVYDALTSENCTRCGDFGPFLCLLTCERTCFSCLYRDPELRLMRACDVQTYFAIQPRHIKNVRSMRSLPSKDWRPWQSIFRKRWKMILVSEAREVALKIHGGEEEMLVQTDADYLRRRQEYDMISQAHEIWGRGDKLSPAVPHNARELFNCPSLGEEFVWRWHHHQMDFYSGIGFVEIPTFDVQKQHAKRGVWCTGCRNIFNWALGPIGGALPNLETQKILERNHFRAWSLENLQQHADICKEEQKGWLPLVKGFLETHPTPAARLRLRHHLGPGPPPAYPPHHGPRGRFTPSHRHRRRAHILPTPPLIPLPRPPPPPPPGWNYYPRAHIAVDPRFIIHESVA